MVWTSDNGAYVDRGGSNAPLRGGLHDTTEGGLRMPCVAWWPGRIPENASSDEITTMMDLLPTFACLAGAVTAPIVFRGIEFLHLHLGVLPEARA